MTKQTKKLIDDTVKLLEDIADGLESVEPIVDRVATTLEATLFNDAVFSLRANFNNEESVRNAQECEQRLKLAIDAVEQGLTEETALKIIYTVYGKEPPVKSENSVVEKAIQSMAPLVMELFTPKHTHGAYPFPSDLPDLGAAM